MNLRSSRRSPLAAILTAAAMAAPALLLAAAAAWARAPAAHVVELADWREGFPPPCGLVRLRGRELIATRRFVEAVRAGGGPQVQVRGGVRRLEEADRIVIVRDADGCHVLVGRGRLPAPSRPEALLDLETGLRDWRAEPSATLVLARRGAVCRLKRGGGQCLGPPPNPETGCPLRIHYYGILPIFFEDEPGIRPGQARDASAGGSASGRFAGTGDVTLFRVRVPGPGSLLVEYRSDAGPGSIGVDIADARGRSLGSGRVRLRAAGTLLVRLTHLGTGPAAYDVGFLYTPEAPVACSVRVQAPDGRTVAARLEVVNRGSTRHPVAEPDAGTVTWLLDGEVLAGARPGRPPRTVFLEPGERLHHTATLTLPAGKTPATLRATYAARANLVLDCLPVPERDGPR